MHLFPELATAGLVMCVIALAVTWFRGAQVPQSTASRISNGLGVITTVIVVVLTIDLDWWPLPLAFGLYGILQAIWVVSPEPPDWLTASSRSIDQSGPE